MKDDIGRGPNSVLKGEEGTIRSLGTEASLSRDEATYHLKSMSDGSAEASTERELAERLTQRGTAVLSGDDKRILPLDPRLGLASPHRIWKENRMRERDKRRRVDILILEPVPVCEAATEKRADEGGT